MDSPRCLAANKHYPTTYICIFNQTRLKKEREALVNTDTLIILVIMSQPSPRLKGFTSVTLTPVVGLFYRGCKMQLQIVCFSIRFCPTENFEFYNSFQLRKMENFHK